MGITARYVPPKVSSVARLKAGVKPATEAMAEVLLAASKDQVPVDTGALKQSGRVVPLEVGTAVTYGRDDDGDETRNGRPTNDYVAIVHEDFTMNHPNGGKSHFLMDPMFTSRREILEAAAEVLRGFLR